MLEAAQSLALVTMGIWSISPEQAFPAVQEMPVLYGFMLARTGSGPAAALRRGMLARAVRPLQAASSAPQGAVLGHPLGWPPSKR